MKKITALIFTILFLAAIATLLHWTVNMVYVPEGHSLQVTFKGHLLRSAKTAEPGEFAKDEPGSRNDEAGVREIMRGPGRHFFCPIWYECRIIPDVVIQPGQVGLVTVKLGKPLPAREFLVDGDIGKTEYKGILRKVLAPGRYRINPHGYEVSTIEAESTKSGNQIKHFGWVNIPTGYVGVVTNLADVPAENQTKGVQMSTLPPGIYLINGREKQVDIVEVGYRETTLAHKKLRNPDGSLQLDDASEPLIEASDIGIDFPSSDGFPINMDFTAIWGLLPEQAPHAVLTFGNVEAVENKVVQPQIESICRNNGSKYSAVQLLVGEDREKFQQQNLDEFKQVLDDKKIKLLYGLVRHIYIPREVRQPIQSAFVADELSLTREQEQLTAQSEGMFREAEKNVELEKEKVIVETDRQFQSKLAEGDREAKRIDAETEKLVAAIRKETAELNAQATRVLGEATNKGKQMIEEANSDRFRLAVEAFGTPEAYNNWIFATGLPENVDLKLLYAGEGTLWTNMENFGVRANYDLPSPKSKDKK